MKINICYEKTIAIPKNKFIKIGSVFSPKYFMIIITHNYKRVSLTTSSNDLSFDSAKRF